jgi:hypothetical protein
MGAVMAFSGPEPQVPGIYDLISPYGHGGVVFVAGPVIAIDVTMICRVPQDTAAGARRFLLGQAAELLAAMDGAGYEIREASVTLRGMPIEATMRLEVIGP